MSRKRLSSIRTCLVTCFAIPWNRALYKFGYCQLAIATRNDDTNCIKTNRNLHSVSAIFRPNPLTNVTILQHNERIILNDQNFGCHLYSVMKLWINWVNFCGYGLPRDLFPPIMNQYFGFILFRSRAPIQGGVGGRWSMTPLR